MTRFLGAAFLAAVVAMVVPGVAAAAGGTYTVVECDPLNRTDPDAILRDSSAYTVKDFCDDPAGDYSIQVGSRTHAINGHRGLVRFRTGSSALGIVGVKVDAKLRGDGGSHPRLWLADDDLVEVDRITGGDSPGADFHHYTWSTNRPGAQQFVASLTCKEEAGCKKSDTAKVWIKDLRLVVADYVDPEVSALSGSLLDGGWIRESASLIAQSEDAGGSIVGIRATVNGNDLAQRALSCATVIGSELATRIVPCPSAITMDTSADSTGPSFVDGPNQLEICGRDFAGNPGCADRTVLVDNTPPHLAFTDTQLAANPEKVRAIADDAASGVAGGVLAYRSAGTSEWSALPTTLRGAQLLAYVDSAAAPPGDYEFVATANDVAGNVASTMQRQDSQPMILTFPLRAGTRLSAHLVPGGERRETIGYGRDSKVSGRLLNASGKPIRGEDVKVVENFGSGALIDRRVRKVRTNKDGFFGEQIPAGPSRTITANYAGSTRYLEDSAKVGRLVVKSKAAFRTSRRKVKEGKSVVFRGRVHHRGARIPPGGKLVELQVRDGKFWNTVRQAFYTKPDGRYHLRYRFRADYIRDAKFHFRLKVAREQGWPYRAPVRTRARKLVVLAR